MNGSGDSRQQREPQPTINIDFSGLAAPKSAPPPIDPDPSPPTQAARPRWLLAGAAVLVLALGSVFGLLAMRNAGDATPVAIASPAGEVPQPAVAQSFEDPMVTAVDHATAVRLALTLQGEFDGSPFSTLAAPGPALAVGTQTSWSYTVTNAGETNLTEILVLDNRIEGTDSTLQCESDRLLPGESMGCAVTVPVLPGRYRSQARVSATAVSTDGQTEGGRHSATAEAHYFGEPPRAGISWLPATFGRQGDSGSADGTIEVSFDRSEVRARVSDTEVPITVPVEQSIVRGRLILPPRMLLSELLCAQPVELFRSGEFHIRTDVLTEAITCNVVVSSPGDLSTVPASLLPRIQQGDAPAEVAALLTTAGPEARRWEHLGEPNVNLPNTFEDVTTLAWDFGDVVVVVVPATDLTRTDAWAIASCRSPTLDLADEVYGLGRMTLPPIEEVVAEQMERPATAIKATNESVSYWTHRRLVPETDEVMQMWGYVRACNQLDPGPVCPDTGSLCPEFNMYGELYNPELDDRMQDVRTVLAWSLDAITASWE